jgi:hypothetical protein
MKNEVRQCKFCKSDFQLTQAQLYYTNKPIFCSKTCSIKHRHAAKYASKRIEKQCENCKTTFKTKNGFLAQRYCSKKCSSAVRITQTNRVETQNNKLRKIIDNESYQQWLINKAKYFACKYEVDYEELLQEAYLSMAQGKSRTIEHTFLETIKKEYRRGFTWITRKPECVQDFNLETVCV